MTKEKELWILLATLTFILGMHFGQYIEQKDYQEGVKQTQNENR